MARLRTATQALSVLIEQFGIEDADKRRQPQTLEEFRTLLTGYRRWLDEQREDLLAHTDVGREVLRQDTANFEPEIRALHRVLGQIVGTDHDPPPFQARQYDTALTLETLDTLRDWCGQRIRALSRQSRNQNDLRILRKSRKTLLRLCPACPVSRLHRPLFRPVATPSSHSATPLPRTDLPSPLPSGPMGVAAQHHPNPMNTMLSFLARFAALVRGVLSGFDRLFFCGSLRRLSHCRGLQHYLSGTPHPLQRLRGSQPGGYRSPGGASSDWPGNTVARSATSNSAQHRKEEHRSGDRRPRPHQGRPDLRAAQCRSLYVVPDPQEPPDAQTRDPVPPTQVPAPVSLPDPSDLRLHAHPHPDRFPSASTSASTVASGWPGRWTRPDCAVRRDNTFTWLEDLDQRRPCSTSRAQANWPQLLDALRSGGQPRRSRRSQGGFPATTTGRSVTVNGPAMSCSRPRKPWPRSTRACCAMPSPPSRSSTSCASWVNRSRPAVRCRTTAATRSAATSRNAAKGYGSSTGSNGNSLKMYDKGSVLRVETLIRDPGDFKVYRPLEGDPQGPKEWRPLRRGLRPAASGRGQPGGQRAATWGR